MSTLGGFCNPSSVPRMAFFSSMVDYTVLSPEMVAKYWIQNVFDGTGVSIDFCKVV